MENDIVKVESAKSEVIAENKEWIEYIFDVNIVLENDCTHDPNFCSYKICTQTNSQEVLVKTKKYISVLTEDSPEASVTVQDASLVRGAVQFKADIEKTLACVLLVSEDLNCLVVKGSYIDVSITELLLEHLQQWINSGRPLAGFPFVDVVNQCMHNVTHSSQFHVQSPQWQQSLSNYSFGEAPTSNVTSEPCDVSNDLQPSMQSLAISSTSVQSDSGGSISDDGEEVISGLKNDPNYKSKVEFALKLGYLEGDLVEALKSLGKNATQNELLSELIKNSANREETLEVPSGERFDNPRGSQEEELIGDSSFNTEVKIEDDDTSPFRHVIMDGSNIAMSHGSKEIFSCRGIQLAVDWFKERGDANITVFVPQWRKETSRSDSRIRDQQILIDLEKEGIVVFTPSRRIGGKRVVCYDDRYILRLAVETDGIVVSNDNYRDLITENDKFKKVVEERLLMYSFVNDRFMPPDDPLGRNGPTLENFLLKTPAEPEPLPPLCPYGSKKCTYGNKCKYYHPERRSQPHKLVTEKLAEQAKQRMQEIKQKEAMQVPLGEKKKLSRQKTPLSRTKSSPLENTSNKTSQVTFSFGQPKKKPAAADDSRYLEYNQMLSQSLQKMEQDRISSESEKSKIPSPRTPEKKESSSRSRTPCDQAGRSSPRFMELRQEGIRSPRGTSPVNLTVPGNSDMPEREAGPKFLSGHLLLAKKLSDEANESDKMKKKSKGKSGDEGYSVSMSPLAYSPAKQVSNPEPVKKKLQRSSTKDKQPVSRQMSLQGKEDQRISQGHLPLHPSYSYDSRLSTNPNPLPGMAERQQMLHDFQNVQHQEISGGLYGPIEPPNRQTYGREFIHGHTALARMASAPDPFTWQQPVRQVPVMMRQNSSSDTQLNKILDQEARKGRGPSTDVKSPVMKDTTGSVKFQIGGAPGKSLLQHQPMPYQNPVYSPNSAQDLGFQQYPQNFHQQQQQQQQQNVPFLHPQTHQMMKANQQQQQQQQQQPRLSPTNNMFHPPQNLHFVHPPGIWDPGPQNLLPPHSSQSYSDSMMWPQSLPQCSQVSATSLAQGTGSSNQLTQMVPSQLASCPVEAPILPSDRRFSLYTDLCRLFPEEKVRAVMNQHPNADNANDICAYLIGVK